MQLQESGVMLYRRDVPLLNPSVISYSKKLLLLVSRCDGSVGVRCSHEPQMPFAPGKIVPCPWPSEWPLKNALLALFCRAGHRDLGTRRYPATPQCEFLQEKCEFSILGRSLPCSLPRHLCRTADLINQLPGIDTTTRKRARKSRWGDAIDETPAGAMGLAGTSLSGKSLSAAARGPPRC